MKISRIGLLFTGLLISCSGTGLNTKSNLSEIEIWKLSWRLVSSSLDKNYQLGEAQLDSLLNIDQAVEAKFIGTGLEILFELGKRDKIIKILERQDPKLLEEICNRELFTTKLSDIGICKSVSKKEIVANKEIQLELIRMYVNDQAVRGHVMTDIITKYNLDPNSVVNDNTTSVDGPNRNRLKEIIRDMGFPTRELVGKDAMIGIFFIIQHADMDKAWQKSQLPNIEEAVRRGDMDGQRYAYLYDRIKINNGEKQLYGTQFSHVDKATRTAQLADTEDLENLDSRRRDMGMMPIEMYKRMILMTF